MFDWLNSSPRPPIPDEKREYFETKFQQIRKIFSDKVLEHPILTPDYSDFPIVYKGAEDSAWETMRIICKRYEIDPEKIHLDFFSQGPHVIEAGGTRIFLQREEKDEFAAGLYWGENEDGKYHIWIENDLLKKPEYLAGVLAHELSHVLLIGEGLINPVEDKDHELITEILTVYFGFGIICGETGGYLRQQSWGYLLGLYAFLRNEEKPEWIKYLSPNLKSDLKNSLKWLNETDAGDHFLSRKKNNLPMENQTMTGKWIIRSVYGKIYGGNEGAVNLWEMDLNENAGDLTGIGNDISDNGKIGEQTKITGAIDDKMIKFSRQYSQSEVLYTGRFNDFLDCFQGTWKIKSMNEKNEIVLRGAGTFEMKRK